MIKTFYTCDCCKNTFDVCDKMFDVNVNVNSLDRRFFDEKMNFSTRKAQWCRNCVDKIGLIGWKQPTKEQPVVPPILTIEEMIREIVRIEMESAR